MHLFALIPGQGASQLLRQLADVLGKRSNNSRRVLAGDLDEHREAGIALDEGGDVRAVRSGKKVSFPVPRHGAILNLGGPLANGDHIEDMPLSTLRVVALGATHPHRPSRYFYWDDIPGSRLRPDTLTSERTLEQAKDLARAEQDKLSGPNREQQNADRANR